MGAIKKVRGVPWVEWKWFKAGKRREWSRGPLPAISEQAADAECALTGGVCIHAGGIPAMKRKVSMTAVRMCIAPRILTFRTVGCSKCRAMELCLGRQ